MYINTPLKYVNPFCLVKERRLILKIEYIFSCGEKGKE